MNRHAAPQNVFGSKPLTPAQLEEELSRLRERRTGLATALAAVQSERERDAAALISSGGRKQIDAATVSTSRVAALKGAASALDDQITAKEHELAEAEVSQQWEDAVNSLVPTVDAAAAALRHYEGSAEIVHKLLAEHIPLMADNYRAWEISRREFVDAVRALIPGVTPQNGSNAYGSPVIPLEAEATAGLLIKALEARCADVRPALAPLPGPRLCVDLRVFQIALSKPYGHSAHDLAQALVAARKEEERAT